MDKFSSLEIPEIYLMIRKTEISKKVLDDFSEIMQVSLLES